jgi:hypothetical protein
MRKMTPFPMKPHHSHIRFKSKGFALVVTLTLMVLLIILSAGMLSLSTVTIRSSSVNLDKQKAQSNARMALMIAIGELQKHAGSDTRITAPASIVDENSPPLLGVWKSWEGTDHETSGSFAGRPIAPDYYSKKQNESGGGRFLTWLISSAPVAADASNPAALAFSAPTENAIPLISAGTLGNSANNANGAVYVKPQLTCDAGGYAWWISGENQKARLPIPYKPSDENAVGEWIKINGSHAVSDPEPFSLDNLIADPTPATKAITLGTANLISVNGSSPTPLESFHDLSVCSVGLLTNTATGGWRKDLSLLTENWDNQPKTNLPFFRLTPDVDTAATIPTNTTMANVYPNGALFYPWASFRSLLTNNALFRPGAVASWANLKDFATHYKRASTSVGNVSTTPLLYKNLLTTSPTENFDYTHRIRVAPVIARVQWIFSHTARQTGPNLYEPGLLLTPVVTIWNPYNVGITVPPNLSVSLGKAMPTALRYTINSSPNPLYNSVMSGMSNGPALGAGSYTMNMSESYNLLPGETRIFSPLPLPANGSTLVSGYRPRGGFYIPIKGPGGSPMSVDGNTSIKVSAKFDTTINDGIPYDQSEGPGTFGVGSYVDMRINGVWTMAYRMLYSPQLARLMNPEQTNLLEVTAGGLPNCVSNPQPFLSTIFGTRCASLTNFPAKGLARSSPYVNYCVMGKIDGSVDPSPIGTPDYNYIGMNHPVNSPYQFSFFKHTGGGDSYMPNADALNRSFIVTGFTSADGLTRCPITFLPLQPMVSLAELSLWDARVDNPAPPYALNIAANSDANPLLPADQVVNSIGKNRKDNLQHDDSYCMNHLLFDDWFFSSITPQPAIFGASARTQKQTYTDFLTGAVPLVNRAYRPILEDVSASNPDALFTKYIEPVNSWKTVASRLEVEGMFNVNSTSVKAWRALLGHARGQRIPHVSGNGGVVLSNDTDYAWSRSNIASDAEAGKPGASGIFPEATEFAGYRLVDDTLLDAMAAEIVTQVRARGPFLSLSEFINRQLSSGDLALAGTLQAALNKLSATDATDPFKALKDPSLANECESDPVSTLKSDEGYQFRDAAAGYSSYGLPGWTRQADILRPLAPILTVRDDTFTIRAYGDARDKSGKVTARAWCEAIVRRTRDFVDPADAPEITTSPTSLINKKFGRRFIVISFRWLSDKEV